MNLRPSLPDFSKLARWVRADGDGSLRISGNRIYILPSRYGVLFGVIVVLMLIGSTNYGNNPAFLLSFLLAGLVSNAMFFTWRNLVGLELVALGGAPVFVGARAHFRMRLFNRRSHARYAIQLAFRDQDPVVTDLEADAQVDLLVPLPAERRGRLHPERVVIATRAPLGLFYAWSYLEQRGEVLVYPKPSGPWRPTGMPAFEGSESGDRGRGTDDFVGHRSYRPGDQPRHIDWKALAAERGLLIKQFGGDRAEDLWLDWDEIPGLDTEQRLSHLCRAILDAHREHRHFGMRLPGREIPPASGDAQRALCLRALALFGDKP